jgi:hypothetical protein
MIESNSITPRNPASSADVLKHARDVAAFLQAAVADRMTPQGVSFDRKAAQALFDVLGHVVAGIDRGRFLALVEQQERRKPD